MSRVVKILLKTSGGIIVVIGLYVVAIQLLYAGKALPGTHSGDLNLAGRTEADATRLLAEKARNYTELRYTYQNRSFTVPADSINLSPDPEGTAREAIASGHGTGWSRLTEPLRVLIRNPEVQYQYRLNEEALRAKLAELTKEVGRPTKNAEIVRAGAEFDIVPEQSGTIVDPAANMTATKLALAEGRVNIPLYVRPSQPAITARGLTAARAYAEMVARRPFTVVAGDQTFRPTPERAAQWIRFTRQDSSIGGELLDDDLIGPFDRTLGIGESDKPIIARGQSILYAEVNREPVGIYVNELASEVDRPPVNARLAFNGGALSISGQPRDGLVVDREKAVGAIATQFRTGGQATVPITAKKADIRAETLPTLKINQLIGSSTTTFGGSPVGRTFNIGVGAKKFDGVLIKPGEEFSFNQVLGDVGPETGYVPELVIKERSTSKEYGGGLCQVSTTMFRAAMNAGLPILDRTNHSYAVHYYAPIGMDATIYPPDPDMKFKNNTPGHILVQTRVAGQSITYDFFGTSDGRVSKTQIEHINATESGGGTASFRYIVEGGPEPINRVFSSTYKPQSAFPISGSLN